MKEVSELKTLLEWQEQRWGHDHPKVIASLETLADLLHMREKYVEAEPLYWQILEKKHKLYGENDLRVADTIYDLACLHEKQENLLECERLFKWTCDIRCRLLPEGDLSLDQSLNKVKEIASKQGLDPEEIGYPAQETGSRTGVPSFDWQSQLERSRLLIMEGNYEFAETLLNCLVEVAAAFEPSSVFHANCSHLLARTQFHQKNLAESLKSFEKALALYEKVSGAKSLETANCLEDMADLRCKLGEAGEAEFLFKWSMQILEQLKPEGEADHKRLQVKLDSIAELCKEVQEISKPEKVASPQDSAASAEEAQSEDQVANYLWNQYLSAGKKALAKNDLTGAESMISRALDKASEFGVQDPRLWKTYCQMAELYIKQGKQVKAESLLKQAQQFCEKTLGPFHPDNAKYLALLGSLHESSGDNAQAAICYDRLVNILHKANRPLVEYGAYLKKLERLHEKPPASFFD